MAEDVDVFYRDLPIMVILERKHGVRKFTPEDLDKVCKKQYGESNAKYDAERDCCVITYPKVKPKGDGFWTTIKLW